MTRRFHFALSSLGIALLCVSCRIGASWAGPNAGGVLMLHVNESLVWCSGVNYCGQSGITDCESADTRVDGVRTSIVYILAAFPPESSPRLLALLVGIDYDDAGLYLQQWQTCADFELQTGDQPGGYSAWPFPNSGTALFWNTARTQHVVEAGWFAAYSYGTPVVLATMPHPVSGSVFADDSVPAQSDAIAGFGTLGFDQPGNNPCMEGPPTGACCLQDPCGPCLEVTADECAALGAIYQGDGTVCSPNPCDCPPVYGACCIGCECLVANPYDCAGQGGVYFGDYTDCQQVTCGDPSPGVCCLPDGSCVVTPQCACLQAGGTWNGDSSECAPTSCSPVPTKRSTWGLIKDRYRQ